MTGSRSGARAIVVSESAPLTVSTAVTELEWDRYVESHADATSDHLWRWRDVVEGVFRQRTVYLGARRGGAIAGVLPLVLFRSRLFGRSVVSLPFLNYGGLLAADAEAADALLQQARAAAAAFGATHIEFRHTTRTRPELPCRQHKLALVRSLPASEDDLWKDIDRKVRNQVRKAQKEGLSTAVGGIELVDEFYLVFAENMRDLGTPVYSKRLFAETLRLFPDRARLTVVRSGARTIAGAVSVSFRDTVLVPWASSLREFRHLCPNMLLYWTMMETAVAAGLRRFDFGRSTPGGGTHQFKLQWGAVETPMNWEYVMLEGNSLPNHGPANPRFNRAIELWKRLPLSVANRLGPWIVRNIP